MFHLSCFFVFIGFKIRVSILIEKLSEGISSLFLPIIKGFKSANQNFENKAAQESSKRELVPLKRESTFPKVDTVDEQLNHLLDNFDPNDPMAVRKKEI